MNYEEKYKALCNIFNQNINSSVYKDADYFEKCVILLRLLGNSYGEIQSKLGMPSKKLIRTVLLKWNPQLINNSLSKVQKYSNAYSELYNILSQTNRTRWNLFGNDIECCIKDHIIYFDGDPLEWWSDIEQSQILESIKNQL